MVKSEATKCIPPEGDNVGFSVRIAPGVRVRASSRGVRASVGPRAARVHFGSGRTGFSTGAGPVSYYTSVGSSPRRSTNSVGTAAANRQLAAISQGDEKQDQASSSADVLMAILHLPETAFPPATRPMAPEPPAIGSADIRARHLSEAKSLTSIFNRSARKLAIQEAERRAQAEIDQASARREADRASAQASLDAYWEALNRNDPNAVLAGLAAAFEDNEAAAAPVGVAGSQVTLVVIVPSASAIPERRPALTAAGNLTLKKLTKRELSDFYKLLIFGHVLVTVKEAFAVAPVIETARIVAVRQSSRDAYGGVKPEVMLAALFERQRLENVLWKDVDAAQIVNDTSSELLLVQKGATKELVPVDLADEPDLAAVISAIDFEDLLQH